MRLQRQQLQSGHHMQHRTVRTRLVPEKSVEFLVIGGGVAGGYAMKEFARQGITDVALVSNERVPPYVLPTPFNSVCKASSSLHQHITAHATQ